MPAATRLGSHARLRLVGRPTISPVAVGVRARLSGDADEDARSAVQNAHFRLSEALADHKLVRPVVLVVEGPLGVDVQVSALPALAAGTWVVGPGQADATLSALTSEALPEVPFRPTTLLDVREAITGLLGHCPLMRPWLGELLTLVSADIDALGQTAYERASALRRLVEDRLYARLLSLREERPPPPASVARVEGALGEPTALKPPWRLKQLSLANLGAFQDLTLDLDADVVLIYGPNGSGKTTVTKALSYLLNAEGPPQATPRRQRQDGAVSIARADFVGIEGGCATVHEWSPDSETRPLIGSADPRDPFTPELRYRLSVLSDRHVNDVLEGRPESLPIGQAMVGVHALGEAITGAVVQALDGVIQDHFRAIDDEETQAAQVPAIEHRLAQLLLGGAKVITERLNDDDLDEVDGITAAVTQQLAAGTATRPVLIHVRNRLEADARKPAGRRSALARRSQLVTTLTSLQELVAARGSVVAAQPSASARIVRDALDAIDRDALNRLVAVAREMESASAVPPADVPLDPERTSRLATARLALDRWLGDHVETLRFLEDDLAQARRVAARTDRAERRTRLDSAADELRTISSAIPETDWVAFALTLTESTSSIVSRSQAIRPLVDSVKGDSASFVKVTIDPTSRATKFSFPDDRKLEDLSSGQRQQFALAWMLVQRMLLHSNEAARAWLGHACLVLDDAAAASDLDSIGREAIALRQIAYGSEPRIQLIVMTHDRELADRYLQLLAPPAGCKMLYHELPRIGHGAPPVTSYEVEAQSEPSAAAIDTIVRHLGGSDTDEEDP
ncbi:MAG: AAA family ATPase [Ardenticatenales bacterium]|nr:AAA family ATPase [Ardenticatenales bacterium]